MCDIEKEKRESGELQVFRVKMMTLRKTQVNRVCVCGCVCAFVFSCPSSHGMSDTEEDMALQGIAAT